MRAYNLSNSQFRPKGNELQEETHFSTIWRMGILALAFIFAIQICARDPSYMVSELRV